MRRLSSIRRDRRGGATVELAMILPVLIYMLLGALDIGRAYSQKLVLTQASQRSIEKVMQSSFQTTAVDSLKAEAASAATASGVNATASDVVVDYWLQCNGVRQTTGGQDVAYNGVCPSSQAYARYLNVQITAKYTPMFAKLKWAAANTDGTFTIKGKAGIRTQ